LHFLKLSSLSYVLIFSLFDIFWGIQPDPWCGNSVICQFDLIEPEITKYFLVLILIQPVSRSEWTVPPPQTWKVTVITFFY
jgi:hypothetical protein